tara:strand:- start:293 stop:436 length:144 start_codon:yes stop_codon:yes gene_type:complete
MVLGEKTEHATMMYSGFVPTRGGQTHFCSMNKVFKNLHKNKGKNFQA